MHPVRDRRRLLPAAPVVRVATSMVTMYRLYVSNGSLSASQEQRITDANSGLPQADRAAEQSDRGRNETDDQGSI